MATGFMASLGQGLSQGAASAYQEQKQKPYEDLRLRQAQLQVQQAENAVSMAPIQQSNAEMQNQLLQAQLKQVQGNLLKSQSFDTFKLYNADGDVRHLNTFLQEAKKSPMGANTFGPVSRFDKLSANNERLLKDSGFTDVQGILNDPEQSKNIVVATLADGTQKLVDMTQVYAGTGFTKHMTDEQLDTMQRQAAVTRALSTGKSVQNVTARERIAREWAAAEGISTWEAYQRLEGNKQAGSTVERIAQEYMDANPGTDYMTALQAALDLTKSTERERYVRQKAANEGKDELAVTEEVRRREARTSAQKDIEAAEGFRGELDQLAGGDFFSADINDPAFRRKAAPSILAIEKTTGKSLSTEEKRLAREIRNLTTLGKTAGEGLTAAETGPLDYILKNVRKYVSDEVGGTEGTSAYETFRNVLRNALYGASLTKTEVDSFTRAAGSLAQQTGPVLQGLRTQMQTLRDQLSGIYDANDPYVSQYYLGMDVERLDKTLEALDERLDMFKSYDGAKLPPGGRIRGKQQQQGTEPGTRPSLDEIFGG